MCLAFRNPLSFLFCLSLFFVCVSATAQPTFNKKTAQQHIEYLASDELEGRMTGTEGETKAANYIASEFKKLGLTNTESTNYFEKFSFVANRAIDSDITFAINKDNLLENGKITALRQSGSGNLDIIDIYSYMEGLSKYKRGESTEIEVLRENKPQTLQITF